MIAPTCRNQLVNGFHLGQTLVHHSFDRLNLSELRVAGNLAPFIPNRLFVGTQS